MKTDKKTIIIVISTLAVGLMLGWLIFGGSESKVKDEHQHETETADETIWTCSMHPQIRQSEPGDCPICGMDLIPLKDENDSGIDPMAISMSPTAMQLASVTTAIVGSTDPVKSVRLNGKIQTDERLVYSQSSHIPGRIEKLLVNFTGEFVKKGQVIASVYSPDVVTAQEELFEAQKIKESQPQLYNAAKEKLKNWKLSEGQIEHILQSGAPMETFNVQADVSGYVTKKMVNPGDYIRKGEAIYEIADLSKVWVLFDVYESDVPWVNKGDKVEFTIASLPGDSFTGTITFLDPVIDPKTRVAKARVEVTNRGLKLKPEMFVSGTVEAKLPNQSNAVVVPKTAVMWTGKRSLVYVKNTTDQGVSFMMRNVTLGPALGESFIIENGLQEGEEIAVHGTFSIDAAAQLAGKTSMMNPPSSNASGGKPNGGSVSTGQDHGNMGHDQHEMKDGNVSHTSFKVAGNCSMCKDRIESTALELDGVNSATWSSEDQVLHLNYNKDKVALDEVHKAIAKAGHDTEKVSAPNDVYDNLPGCCKYSRHQPESNEYIETSFQVSGNCSMCKNRIEKTAKTVKGVRQAVWNAEEQKLTVEVDADIDMDDIHKAIANAGHDTEKMNAPDEVYEELPGCCKYTREK